MHQNKNRCFSNVITIALTFLASNLRATTKGFAKAELTNNNNNDSGVIDLGETMFKLDSIIDNLADFYGDPDSDTGLQSRYLIPTEDDTVSSMALFNVTEQKLYFTLLEKYLQWMKSSAEMDAKKMAMVGQSFQMYNELLDAIEADADELLGSSTYPNLVLARNDPNVDRMREYLRMVMQLFSDEKFHSEMKDTRTKIIRTIREISGIRVDI